MSSNFYESQILDTIESMVNSAVAKAGYDKTIRATIIECTDAIVGKYKVKYQNNIFEAYANNKDIKYAKDTQVYILVPNGDMGQNKIILYSVYEADIEKASLNQPTGRYDFVGENSVNYTDAFGLRSGRSDDKIILYNIEDGTNLINYNEAVFANNLKGGDGFAIGADFQTALQATQQKKGDYGIQIDIDFNNTTTGSPTTQTYILSMKEINPNLYLLLEANTNIKHFLIEKENYKCVHKITIFAKNFPFLMEESLEDIFISNFQLHAVKTITNDNFVHVKMDRNYFNKDELDSSVIIANAEVYLNGELTEKDYQYYWFKQNTSIEGDLGIESYGWECLNPQVAIDSDNDEYTYETNLLSFDISKGSCLSYENNYKLMIIYGDLTLTQDFSIFNEDAQYKLKITSDEGTQFAYGNGAPTLTMNIETAQTGETYKYVWAKSDGQNLYEILEETTSANEEYRSALAQYTALKEDLEQGKALNTAANRSLLQSYLTTLKSYDIIERVENEHIYKAEIPTVNQYLVYFCSVYKIVNNTQILIGTSSIVLTKTNILEGEYGIIINNGVQTFNYTADGYAPTYGALDRPLELKPLSITLIDNKGKEFTEEMMRQCEIKWYTPINKLVIAEDAYNQTSLEYSLAEQYDTSKLEGNNIKVEVNYQGRVFNAETQFTFVKDGEPGTNGTGIICKIVPNTAQPFDEYPMLIKIQGQQSPILNFTPIVGNKWFKVEIWKDGIIVDQSSALVDITWSVLTNTNDTTNFNVSTDGSFTADNAYRAQTADIIKAEILYDGKKYYATLPLITAYLPTVNGKTYSVKLEKNTGCRYVMYSSSGNQPQYDNTIPFTVKMYQSINGNMEDITNVQLDSYKLTYKWYRYGRIAQNGAWVSDLHFNFDGEDDTNKVFIIPDEKYNGYTVNNAVECIIKRSSTTVARIHIPIHFYLNRYSLAALNEWDGNGISLDSTSSKTILTPQAGAGKKEDDNTFTGVLIGSIRENISGESEEGLFGLYHGNRTIFLDAHTGKAEFGKSGSGQIILDPTNNTAKIQSGNYSTTGTKGGMQIDFTTPEINFGTGNFSVTKDGYLTAKGGGSIASWQITDSALIKYDSSNKEYAYMGNARSSSTKPIYIGNTLRTNLVFRLGYSVSDNKEYAKFGVDSSGILYANGAIISGTLTAGANSAIGPWNVTNTSIWYGNANYGNANGLYFGTSGLSLGSTFKVSSAGILTASSAVLSGTLTAGANSKIGPWNVTANAIYNVKTGIGSNNQTGVYIGTDGIGLGPRANWGTSEIPVYHAKFEVLTNGTLYATGANIAGKISATSGSIGGWTINTSTLTGGNITLNSNGSISGGTTGHTWSINTTGKLTAADVDLTGKITATSGTFGSGTNKITILNDSTQSYSAIYSGSKSSLNSTNAGFYIGTNGISIGAYDSTKASNPFQVTSAGVMTVRSGYIGNGSNGWTIADTVLYNGKAHINNSSNLNETGVYIGTTGIALGKTTDYGTSSAHNYHSVFEVSNAGALYASNATVSGKITASSGQIGGWNIDSVQLSKQIGNFNLEIRSDRPDNQPALLVWDRANDRYNWYVQPNGYMYARNCEISGTLTAGSVINNSTINSSSLTSGSSINIDNGTYWLKMGYGTDHPEVSGLNVTGSGGINMHGGGISEVSEIGIRNGGTGESHTVRITSQTGNLHELVFFKGVLCQYWINGERQ